MAGPLLRLGAFDAGHGPSVHTTFLRSFHDWTSCQRGLRDEADGLWRDLRGVSGSPIREVQTCLAQGGFLPHGPVDGVYGYRTRAAVRLFQEHVRVVDADESIGRPDGVVGPKTRAALRAWEAASRVATWAHPDFAPNKVSRLARSLLDETLLRCASHPDTTTRAVDRWNGATATLRSSAWGTSYARIHLVGIRRNAAIAATKRANDDLFALLVGNMTFFFLGSTDPNPSLSRADEPYLVRGQHRYRIGWHKLSPMGQLSDGSVPSGRAYLALKPAVSAGVLVARDRDLDNALSPADLAEDLEANPTINIHWSGKGTSNWSAGCQVVGGARYIDHEGRLVDCTPHAATYYTDLAHGETRGAWNVLMDILTVALPQFGIEGSEVLFTLLYEEDLRPDSGVTPELFRQLVERLAGRRAEEVVVPGG